MIIQVFEVNFSEILIQRKETCLVWISREFELSEFELTEYSCVNMTESWGEIQGNRTKFELAWSLSYPSSRCRGSTIFSFPVFFLFTVAARRCPSFYAVVSGIAGKFRWIVSTHVCVHDSWFSKSHWQCGMEEQAVKSWCWRNFYVNKWKWLQGPASFYKQFAFVIWQRERWLVLFSQNNLNPHVAEYTCLIYGSKCGNLHYSYLKKYNFFYDPDFFSP